MYNRESYPDEQVEIDVVSFVERGETNSVVADVYTEYGKTRVSYGFPKGQRWSEGIDGTEKFLLKLKDLALDKVKPDEEINPERVEEKDSMQEALMSEKKQV